MADSFVQENLFNLWLAARTGTVIVARTVGAAQDPASWSEHEIVLQKLTVLIEQTICGEPAAETQLVLDLPVVEGSRIANTTPGLASWIKSPGSRSVMFLENGQITDEDLSILPATDQMVDWIREHCDGPMPAGVAAVLFTFAEIANADNEVGRILNLLEPAVVDVYQADLAIARLTISHGTARVFSGIRFARVRDSRGPDLAINATAEQLARALAGLSPIEPLIINNDGPALVAALKAVIDVMGKSALRISQLMSSAKP